MRIPGYTASVTVLATAVATLAGFALNATSTRAVGVPSGGNPSGAATTTTEASPSEPSSSASTPNTFTFSDLRDTRYCEMFLIKNVPGGTRTTIYNTTGLDTCPTAQWNALNPQAVARQFGVNSMYKNGQRFWVLDKFVIANAKDVQNFGGILSRNVATADQSGAGAAHPAPYQRTTVNRTTQWYYEAGKLVYELVAPNGQRFAMQAYCRIVDPALTIDDLPDLAYRLHLPQGWKFQTRYLDGNMSVVPVNGKATITQDELQNTYMLENSP
ncbi:hypothetical protein AB0N92_24390 [Streptomyces sp. NPDC093248]|uniref:hypothetical protein n=1 Tax=Streptomyces sp. NPDC093248 TaxID=3155072 RepID=UPI0034484DE6